MPLFLNGFRYCFVQKNEGLLIFGCSHELQTLLHYLSATLPSLLHANNSSEGSGSRENAVRRNSELLIPGLIVTLRFSFAPKTRVYKFARQPQALDRALGVLTPRRLNDIKEVTREEWQQA